MPAVVALWRVTMNETQTCIFLCNLDEFGGFVWSLWDCTLVGRGAAEETHA